MDLYPFYLLAASEHFQLYREGDARTAALTCENELAYKVLSYVPNEVPFNIDKDFDKELYYKAWNEVSSGARWKLIIKSHATRKE